MSGMERLLQRMQHRPGLFLAVPSIRRLRGFLDGYDAACRDAGQDSGYMKVQRDFSDWLRRRYSLSGSLPWDRIITVVAGGEESALDLFFDMWTEFIEAK